MEIQQTKVEDVWAKIDGNIVTCGLTKVGVAKIAIVGDLRYIQLPKVGNKIKFRETIATIETQKAAIDIESPVNGTIQEVNRRLEEEKTLFLNDPTGEGWLVKIKVESQEELNSLSP